MEVSRFSMAGIFRFKLWRRAREGAPLIPAGLLHGVAAAGARRDGAGDSAQGTAHTPRSVGVDELDQYRESAFLPQLARIRRAAAAAEVRITM
jgi:hypothetical protein